MFVDYKELGRRIAVRRKELGMKQAQVNEAAGLSDKYLSNIERATSVLSVDVLMRLCEVLETSPDYLLLGAVSEIKESDLQRAVAIKASKMTSEQLKLALSLMDWIVAEKLE